MKIAMDISPISKRSTSAHKVRGVGSYINLLVENLPKYDKKNKYIFIEDKNFPRDADLIHYPYFDPFFITLPSKFTTKTVVTVHDLTPLVFQDHFPAGIKGRIKWVIQKSRLRRADLVITDSDSSKKDVRDIVGIDEDKIRTVYLAADEQFEKLNTEYSIQNTRKKFSLPENFLLYVGDATWNKNLPRLIEAVKKTEHKLVMVGKVWESNLSDISGNPWNADLGDVIRTIEGDPQFIRLGFVSQDDLVKIYNLATVFVMPSIYEGFGLPVLEAMSCGCPVITSREGSLPEVAGDAALYVDPLSEQNIAESIEKIFAELKLQNELAKKGLEQSKKFSIHKMMKDLINVYEEIYG